MIGQKYDFPGNTPQNAAAKLDSANVFCHKTMLKNIKTNQFFVCLFGRC